MGEEFIGTGIFLTIVGFLGGWAWGWAQVAVLARRRGWRKLLCHALGLGGGFIAAFGAFMLLGAFLMPSPDGGEAVVGCLGAVVLSPFVWLHWRNRQAGQAVRATASDRNQARKM